MGASIALPLAAQNAEKKRNFFKIFAAEKACWPFFTIARAQSRKLAHIQVELISSIGVRCVLPRKGAGKARDASCGGATRKERNAASALSGQNPEGAARLGELLRYEFGSRRPVLTQIRALHFIPNGTRSHSRLLMK
ncbi:hypothetical protein RJO15_05435 [Herbaspirillum huttiense F1]|uniref:Uncharacterized protein n=1 Tax=Herbaspirillum huttiense subsp. lycopersici TaxID=3074428 RepID=A0ABU2EHW1_9BURK|nr:MULTISPECIES: hypothetical protein [Herbaspirillum]MBP1313526.1 hypothetical protein [Herbaspirillum sp. 1130]MDR9847729.1 hypothetical protein [Herbaspirillum huttiense SE1]MDT0355205.1 hypothetical protein [Herbaspirillum huttiense F1]